MTINKVVNKFKPQLRSGIKGTSFATTVSPVENKTLPGTKVKEDIHTARRTCLCCGGGHTLDSCPQLEKRTHKDKIGFLREKGVCFSCLCIVHISKDCRKRISCAKYGLKHPNILYIHPKGRRKDSDQAEKANCPKLTHRSACLSAGGIFQDKGIFRDGPI